MRGRRRRRPERTRQDVRVGQGGDDAVGAGGRRLLDDARHVGQVAGGRVAVFDIDAHLLAGKRQAVLDRVPPAVAVGRMAHQHIALVGMGRGADQGRRGHGRRGRDSEESVH